jgi:hypothetical protein
MLKARVSAGLLGGCLLLWGGVAQAAPPPSAEVILKYRPRQDTALYSTPAPQEVASCKVEAVKGQEKGAGWMLRDPRGQPLRRFYDSRYDGRSRTSIDTWSYYHDGVETYREQEEGEQMHYRWLNAGGMKWGIDLNKDGRIDTWRAISAEEVSQEIVRAVVRKDFARLQALLITDAEISALGLPEAHAKRISTLRAGAEAKFRATVAKLANLNDKTHWVHLETGAPQCLPAEQIGARADLIRYTRGTILVETDGKNDWLQSGEIIRVGSAWRIIDAPAAGADAGDDPARGAAVADNPELQNLLKELGELDGAWAKKSAVPSGAEVARYNLDRTNLIEKIIAAVRSEEREQWIRQAADCLAAAVQSSGPEDRTAYNRLTALLGQLQKAMGSEHPLVAYVLFREMQADYSVKVAAAKATEFAKVQQEWLERLAKFVKAHPSAEDAPDALLSLAWVSEVIGKEIEAKNWYQQLARDFGDRPQGAKARGALRRMNLAGQVLEISGTTLAGQPFDLASQRGKVVVVYYWASWSRQSADDFPRLKQLIDTYGPKGLELVTVSLDPSAGEANAFLQKSPLPGTHLHQDGGMESKLATDYGVMMLPNLFLADRSGKVVSISLQVGTLEDELKKLLK